LDAIAGDGGYATAQRRRGSLFPDT